ncbi:unnamed protein product [Prunus armeniaca]
MESGFELCFLESEVYATRMNNLCAANSVMCNFGAHFSDSLMKRFRESCFGHLLGLHKIAFSGQIVHALALQRVGGLGGNAHNRFMKAHFTNRGHITCNDLENAFLKSERGSEDSFKLGLLYFVEFVIMGKPQNAKINEEYLHLKESDEENDGKGKGQKKEKKAIWVYELISELGIPPLRHCKWIKEPALVPRICRWESMDKVPEFRKLNAYIFQSNQPVILRLLRLSQLEMSQLYWSWGSDVLECDAPSVAPRVCKDLDELNFVVQQLRNEVAVLHREKGQLKERVLCLEKCTNHADVRKTGDAGEERNKTKDAREESQKTEDEDAGEESQKTKDAGEESDKTEDGGAAESRERCIDLSTDEGECGKDVIVGVRQKRGRGKSEILGPTMNRAVPRDSLLEVAKFCWEWGQEENSHARLCGEDGMEGSHNFFVRLLTKNDWLDDSKCAALDYKQGSTGNGQGKRA